jgi:hypothetical protein
MKNEKAPEEKMLVGIERLSENEKLELFKVEELETRLELAALLASSGQTNSVCQGSCNYPDASCW